MNQDDGDGDEEAEDGTKLCTCVSVCTDLMIIWMTTLGVMPAEEVAGHVTMDL